MRYLISIWILFGLFAGCASSGGQYPSAERGAQERLASDETATSVDGLRASAANVFSTETYRLGAADRVRLIVFQEPDLSGEFAIGTNGMLSLPLVGPVKAEGNTIDELRLFIENKLSEGYLRDANVSAEIVEYRPYYIFGEVERAGNYAFSPGMTVIKAVAAAGGFTYRAKKNVVYIQRSGSTEEQKVRVDPETTIFPGDVIRVGERFF